MGYTIEKSEQEWREQLSPEEYRICREKGTEAAFSGAYHARKEAGIYRCTCCGADLFSAADKFNSGSGWPSFTRPLAAENTPAVDEHPDNSHGMVRTEVVCHRCGAHLGHVFADGPTPTGGLRYCINSVSLKRVKA